MPASRKPKEPQHCPACAALPGACDCVILPEEFRRLGYSGLFHADARILPEFAEKWRAKAPCLLPQSGWALARVEGEPCAILVRRDSDALCETYLKRGPDAS